MGFESRERSEVRANVLAQRVDEKPMTAALMSGRHEAKHPKVRRESRQPRNRLRPHAPMTRREAYMRAGVRLQPLRAFEREHVRRIGDDLRAPNRRHDLVLAR